MRRMFWMILLWSNIVLAQGKALIVFEKGEVSPGVASSVEKSGQGQYKLKIPGKPGVPSADKIRQQLEKELKAFPGLKVSTQADQVIINFQGPDTPLLQALSRIEVQP
ncbi:MAG TPA: hypothetical protein VE954_39945 [Oligoflexus sp.]|uniref:hypothetical protein n=1 Tax=Oligoflexus sp. TaxID=1971216 RepID=UPI002D40352A|nr:hypothetical protein [Oligoflexus sp.]HYX39315.1 hypothetical protein [Oligoflexus sp.]